MAAVMPGKHAASSESTSKQCQILMKVCVRGLQCKQGSNDAAAEGSDVNAPTLAVCLPHS